MLLELPSFLDANSTTYKILKSLVTQVKYFLTQWTIKEKNHGYKKFGAKNLSTWKSKLGKKNRNLGKITKKKTS